MRSQNKSDNSTIYARKRKRLVLAFSVIVVLTVLIVVSNWSDSRRPVHDVQIVGAMNVSAGSIRKKIEPFCVGMEKSKVDFNLLLSKLKELPIVESADFQYKKGNNLEVRIVERTPAAVTALPGGRLVATDTSGATFEYHDLPRLAGLPVIEFHDSRSVMRREAMLAFRIKAMDSPFCDNLFSEIRCDESASKYMLISTDDKKIYLGSDCDIEDKLARLSRFAKLPLNDSSGYSYIDLRWHGKLITD